MVDPSPVVLVVVVVLLVLVLVLVLVLCSQYEELRSHQESTRKQDARSERSLDRTGNGAVQCGSKATPEGPPHFRRLGRAEA